MNEIELTREQWQFLATLCAGMSQVAVASLVIPFFLDDFRLNLALFGVVAAIAFVVLGLTAARKVNIV